ncbi:aminotransferase A [Fodinisporobacter ferrooxydans]|uniref:Aminotransferase n=1 Tax=Fodinisporobacter ferrooxydans TaxID=2901836 RepID=A0ABY4CSB4_9BACL|nr:aminotransferase A [Alicyclobacillaceae bacterium MYW30-H2]
MEHLINPNVRKIQISGIRKFANLVAQHQNVISLTIGQPDFPTPQHVKERAKTAIDENRTGYTENAGLLDARKAACQFLSIKYGLSYDPKSEVIITNGATEAIDIALRTVLAPGAEVILPGPVYPGYEPVIRLCGAIPVFVDTRADGFKLRAEAIEQALTEHTRCVILPYPSNPTGTTLSYSELESIANVLQNRNVFVISDEIYSELVYDGSHVSIASFPSMREKTIVINGLSKSHSMTGWRIGLTFAPEYITRHMLKVHQYSATCASSISQHAALEAFEGGVEDAVAMKVEYVQRRDYVFERLQRMGFDGIKPSGAFYLFPSIRPFAENSFDFAAQLLEKAKVAVVPGAAFSEYGEGYIRISYAYSMETLKEGMDRIEYFLHGNQTIE